MTDVTLFGIVRANDRIPIKFESNNLFAIIKSSPLIHMALILVIDIHMPEAAKILTYFIFAVFRLTRSSGVNFLVNLMFTRLITIFPNNVENATQ